MSICTSWEYSVWYKFLSTFLIIISMTDHEFFFKLSITLRIMKSIHYLIMWCILLLSAYGDNFAAKRARKLVQRRAVDYTSTMVQYIQVRLAIFAFCAVKYHRSWDIFSMWLSPPKNLMCSSYALVHFYLISWLVLYCTTTWFGFAKCFCEMVFECSNHYVLFTILIIG